MGGMGPPGMGGMGPPGMGAPGFMPPEQTGEKLPTTRTVDIDKLNLQNTRLAENINPLRMGIIVGSFPYKKQIEEYRNALRFETLPEMYADPRSVPQFVGMDVERREVFPDGQATPWWKLDLERTYGPHFLKARGQTEPDEPELAEIVFEGLAMPRVAQFRPGRYPKVEAELKHIEETLAELKKAREGKKIARPNPFADDKFSIFNARSFQGVGNQGGGFTGGMGPGGMGMGPPPGMRPGMQAPGVPPGPGEGGPAGYGTTTAQQFVLPEYCLLRILDVTIQPGKTYEYRFKVRMANPNYQRPDVVFPNVARDKEIASTDWIPVTERLVVPPELYYYAVDVRKLDKEKARLRAPSRGQVALQAQKWIDHVFPNPDDFKNSYPVGDWSVAERLLVYPGESVAQTPEIEVPIWLYPAERFALATKGRKDVVPVNFGTRFAPSDPLLVSAEGGDNLSYLKLTEVGENNARKHQSILDRAPQELLILTADGRLVRRDSETDKEDKERVDRYDAWKARIKEVREAKRQPLQSSPFGPGGPGEGGKGPGGGGS
jgi:hypothetical protein